VTVDPHLICPSQFFRPISSRDNDATDASRSISPPVRGQAGSTKLRNLTVVRWSIYPVVWLLGPFGLGLLLVETEAMVVTYLDLLANVGIVVIAVNGREALAVLEARERSPTAQ